MEGSLRFQPSGVLRLLLVYNQSLTILKITIDQYQKPKHIIKTWAKDLNRYFFKEAIHIASEQGKDALNIIITREMQIKPQ